MQFKTFSQTQYAMAFVTCNNFLDIGLQLTGKLLDSSKLWNWRRIWFNRRKNNFTLLFPECDLPNKSYYRFCTYMIITTGFTCIADSAYPSWTPGITPSFDRVCVAQFLISYVVFRILVFIFWCFRGFCCHGVECFFFDFWVRVSFWHLPIS